jgi:hypothetical protein
VTAPECHDQGKRTPNAEYLLYRVALRVLGRKYRSFNYARARWSRAAGCLRVGRRDLIGQCRVPGAQRLIEGPDGGLGFGHAFAG